MTDKKAFKIDKDTASDWFYTWAENIELDLNDDSYDDEERSELNKHKRRIIKAIQKGALEFNEDGEAVYTPQKKKSKHQDPLTFRERTGASLMASDRKKAGNDVAKMYAMLAEMTQTTPGTISGLVGEDIKVAESLFVLLMD